MLQVGFLLCSLTQCSPHCLGCLLKALTSSSTQLSIKICLRNSKAYHSKEPGGGRNCNESVSTKNIQFGRSRALSVRITMVLASIVDKSRSIHCKCAEQPYKNGYSSKLLCGYAMLSHIVLCSQVLSIHCAVHFFPYLRYPLMQLIQLRLLHLGLQSNLTTSAYEAYGADAPP